MHFSRCKRRVHSKCWNEHDISKSPIENLISPAKKSPRYAPSSTPGFRIPAWRNHEENAAALRFRDVHPAGLVFVAFVFTLRRWVWFGGSHKVRLSHAWSMSSFEYLNVGMFQKWMAKSWENTQIIRHILSPKLLGNWLLQVYLTQKQLGNRRLKCWENQNIYCFKVEGLGPKQHMGKKNKTPISRVSLVIEFVQISKRFGH